MLCVGMHRVMLCVTERGSVPGWIPTETVGIMSIRVVNKTWDVSDDKALVEGDYHLENG